MKKLMFIVTVILAFSAAVVFSGSSVFTQVVLAKGQLGHAALKNQTSLSDGGNGGGHYGDRHPDSATILLPFSSEITTTDLTSSFSNIIDTQIYTGLGK